MPKLQARFTRKSTMHEFIRQARREIRKNSIPMAKIARDAEVSRAHLYSILGGDIIPTLTTADKIAKAVGLEIQIRRVPPISP